MVVGGAVNHRPLHFQSGEKVRSRLKKTPPGHETRWGSGSECGQARIRTADTCIFSAVLYQLSYLAAKILRRSLGGTAQFG